MTVSASSADVERDFSSASNLVTKRRTRMDAAFVEMVLLLHLNINLLPPYECVADLGSLENAMDYVPRRFKDRSMFTKYLALDPYKPEEDEEEEEMADVATGRSGPASGRGRDDDDDDEEEDDEDGEEEEEGEKED
jgi:hypothetical protein